MFDFIRPEVGAKIFDAMVTSVLRDAAASGRHVEIAPEALATLGSLCLADLSNGGRGIRNKIEAHLINPLSRALFEREDDGPVRVAAIQSGAITSLMLEAG